MIEVLKDLIWINDKKTLKIINIMFFCSIIFMLAVHYIWSSGTMLFNLDSLLDIEHYFDIAMSGYTQKYQYAFFPLLPLIMKGFSFINIPIVGTTILNNLICLLTAYLIYNLSVSEYKATNKRALLLSGMWIFSPIRPFTLVPYTEALFVFNSLIAFSLYKKRKAPILTGIFMGLSVATRSVGSTLFFVLFLFLFYDLIKNSEKWKQIIYILKIYIPATIISCLYPIYLQMTLGNWKYFVDVQMEVWSRQKGNIFEIFMYDMNLLQTTSSYIVYITIIFTYISLIIAVILMAHSIRTEKYKKLDLALIVIISLISFFSTYRNNGVDAGTCSFFRYIFGLFPVYLFINNKTSKKLIGFILLAQIIMLIIVSICFLSNVFIA